MPPELFFSRVRVRIDQITALVFERPEDRLFAAVAELIDVARLDVLELR